MSNATRTLREAARILRDPYGRDPDAVQQTANELDRIAGMIEEFLPGEIEAPNQSTRVLDDKCPWCWWTGPRELQCQTISQGATCNRHGDRRKR